MTADVTRLADESRSSIAAVCRALEVPRSSVYARRSRSLSARARDTAALDVDIAAVHAQSERRYGSPRVHRELQRRGRAVSRKRIAARMRLLGLQVRAWDGGRPTYLHALIASALFFVYVSNFSSYSATTASCASSRATAGPGACTRPTTRR